MLRSIDDVAALRRRFLRQVVLPIGVVAMAAIGIAGSGLWWTTRQSDSFAIERQKEKARRAIAAAVDEIAYEQQADALWDPLVRELNKDRPDPAWLDENVGGWLNQMFGQDQVYILDANDLPVYAAVNGTRVPAGDFEKSRVAFAPLIDRERGRLPIPQAWHSRTSASTPVAGFTARTRDDTIHVSEVSALSGRPIAASVMKIGSPKHDVVERPGSNFIMIVVVFLDGRYLHDLAHRNMIDGMRYSPVADPVAGEHLVPLRDETGGEHGFFMWQPDLPGTRIMRLLAPVTIASVTALILALVLLARWLWTSVRRLENAVCDLQASEAQAQHLALHDALTGLPNRTLLADRLEQALIRARRGETIAILTLDLDRFKQVNDTWGHHAGDELIKQLGMRLVGMLPSTDTVARLGGDEFTILLCDIRREDTIEVVCRRIFEAIQRPFDLSGTKVFVGISIGIAMAPIAAIDRGELMRKADIALYCAKADGRNCHRYFVPSMDETVKYRRTVEDELRTALAKGGELQVHYQPEVSAFSGNIIGLEALVRWDHPTRGMIGPDKFIPVAEDSGLITKLGEWVLAEAARVALQWPDLFMAVNLSPVQFRASGFAERTAEIVRRAGCDPARIELEVTETVLIEDNEQCQTALEDLRCAGFRIALDDFGTGYSSLSHLRRFHVDKIKIDRSFTQGVGDGMESTAIVAAVVALGRAIGLTVTAEGVETYEQMQLLSAAGCNQLQGYLFSKALPESALAAFMASRLAPRGVKAAVA